ncbi:SubName: Full=Uncharacterized protein {ECO:0000313/EMBL:CCA69194.1} [Serendipita indica DSM 11827]|nr:SubName: Full=Uncharacterized protein {ECO:0000313/EMBL:CCA69194.1} [Serendipita indica DSM 11827]
MSQSTTTQFSPQGQMQNNQDSQLFIDEAIHKNFTYVLCLTYLMTLSLHPLEIHLRHPHYGPSPTYYRILWNPIPLHSTTKTANQRRRLRATTMAEQEALPNDAQRRKKHKHHGKKPKLASAWIGDGPLPISLSTEALLEVIQPFSLAKADEKTLLREDTEKLSSADRTALSSHSTTSLDEKLASTDEPQRPQIHDIQLLNAGFLIAMPMPRPNTAASLRLRSSPSSVSLSHSSSEGSCESDAISLAESRWTDHLCHGELPELTLGISTISVLSSSTAS